MLPRGLLKEHAQLFSLLLRVMDVLAVLLAGWAAAFVWLGAGAFSGRNFNVTILAAFICPLVFSFFHLYQSVRVLSLGHYLGRLFQAWVSLLVVLAGFAFLTKTGESFSRGWFLLAGLFLLLLLILLRGGLLLLLRLMRAHGWNERRVVMLGAGAAGQKLAFILQQAHWTGFRVTHVFDDQPAGQSLNQVPVLLMPDNLDVWLTGHADDVDEIWLTLPLDQKVRMDELIHQLRHHPVPVRIALDVLPTLGLTHCSMADMGGVPMLNLNMTPITGINRVQKVIEDRLLGAVLFVFAMPLLLLIALAVRLTSKGPVLFRQQRHGWDGRIITVYKFRTMFCHEEELGHVTQASRTDPRVTPLGRWLRRTSFDELPQLINVLQGRMSIVGPRPHAVAHNVFYRDVITDYMQRHRVKPGITGWAQVNGWRGETDTLDKMQKRVEYDLYYIENWSLLFDLKILLLTFLGGFMSRNAY